MVISGNLIFKAKNRNKFMSEQELIEYIQKNLENSPMIDTDYSMEQIFNK